MSDANEKLDLNLELLRSAIRKEYEAVAHKPEHGFHFHTGRSLAQILGYQMSGLTTSRKVPLNLSRGPAIPLALA